MSRRLNPAPGPWSVIESAGMVFSRDGDPVIGPSFGDPVGWDIPGPDDAVCLKYAGELYRAVDRFVRADDALADPSHDPSPEFDGSAAGREYDDALKLLRKLHERMSAEGREESDG